MKHILKSEIDWKRINGFNWCPNGIDFSDHEIIPQNEICPKITSKIRPKTNVESPTKGLTSVRISFPNSDDTKDSMPSDTSTTSARRPRPMQRRFTSVEERYRDFNRSKAIFEISREGGRQ